MKKNEKIGICTSLILVIMGLIGLIYTISIKNSTEINVSMYGLSLIYLIYGIIMFFYYIKLSKNKKKSDEQENIYEDERENSNKNKACAITFRIFLWLSIIADFIITVFLRQYQEYVNILNIFIGLTILTYLITYYIISKRN